MKRYYPLGVDQLEDRCVPATLSEMRAEFFTNLQAGLQAAADSAQSQVVAQYLDWTADSLQYVIDVYEYTPDTLPTPVEIKDVRDALRDFWANPDHPFVPIPYPPVGGGGGGSGENPS